MKKIYAILVALVMVISLASCAPKTPVDAKDKLEDMGYTVTVDGTLVPGGLKLFGVDGVESYVSATKKLENGEFEIVQAYKFAEKAQAKDALEKIKSWAENNGKETNLKQTGCWVYGGTEQGMKDFN